MVSKLFDTSALLASTFKQHPGYAWAVQRVDQVARGEARGLICTHALAELYATLTINPQGKLSPNRAVQVIERFTLTFQVVALELSDYQAALGRVKRLELLSGAIYDVLRAEAFLKSGADSLVTLNAKHFLRLGEDISSRIEAPSPA